MRLLSSDYRAGLAARAVGDHREAARRFAACGRTDELAEALQGIAAAEADPRAAVETLRRACAAAESADRTARCAADLSTALMRLAATVPPSERSALALEAARLRFDAADHRGAAAAYELADELGMAADAWAKAGAIAEMERVLAAQRGASVRADIDAAWVETVVGLARSGRPDEALARISGAADDGADGGRLAEARSRVESLLCPAGRAILVGPDGRLVLCGGPAVEVGRDPLADLVVGAGSVSRRHLRLTLDGTTLVAVDLGSAAGTSLDGTPLSASVPLTEAASLWMGPQCELTLAPVPGGWRVRALVDGAGGPTLHLGTTFEVGSTRVELDGRWWRRGAGGPALVAGSPLGPWKVVVE